MGGLLARIVEGVVKGLITPLLSWWTTYRQGRLAERAGQLDHTLERRDDAERAMEAARGRVGRGPLVMGDDGRVRRGGQGGAPPSAG